MGTPCARTTPPTRRTRHGGSRGAGERDARTNRSHLSIHAYEAEAISCCFHFGPQHPSTHGVFRMDLHLDGETVVKATPYVGYLHRAVEKLCEQLTYVQLTPIVDKNDYVAPISNEQALNMAFEKLLGIEVPRRARWPPHALRRAAARASHLIWLAAQTIDLGGALGAARRSSCTASASASSSWTSSRRSRARASTTTRTRSAATATTAGRLGRAREGRHHPDRGAPPRARGAEPPQPHLHRSHEGGGPPRRRARAGARITGPILAGRASITICVATRPTMRTTSSR